MKKELIILVAAVLLVSAIVFLVPTAGRGPTEPIVSEEVEEESEEYAAETTIIAKIGEEAKALGVSITPLEVLEDSRCPTDVVCIQAGTVRLSVRIKSALGESVMNMTLGGAITTEAEKVVFGDALPPSRSEIAIRQNEYRFEFTVSKRHPMEI